MVRGVCGGGIYLDNRNNLLDLQVDLQEVTLTDYAFTVFSAPTEPSTIKSHFTQSPITEQYGVDYLVVSSRGILVGIQRKTIDDLIASLRDGRLSIDIGKMKRLDYRILMIEGVGQWTTEGEYVGYGSFSRQGLFGLEMSFSFEHQVFVVSTRDKSDSTTFINECGRWFSKSRHNSLVSRPKPQSEWGNATNRDFGIHLLQGLPSVGPELAARIYDHFGGVPMVWSITLDDLVKVEGIGKEKAARILDVLYGRKNIGHNSKSLTRRSARNGDSNVP